MSPKLIVQQKITAFVNQYEIYEADAAGEKVRMVAFAQQKRLAFKEKVIFYSDKSKSAPMFTFRAEKVLDVHGRYLVEDMEGLALGGFKKLFKQSLVSSTWQMFDADGTPRFSVAENNTGLAVLRRFGGFIPVVGELVDLVVLFFRYHFAFASVDGGQKVGEYRKTTLLRDYYTLSYDDAAYGTMDWRLFAAMAVALDALQSR
jgi:uncharacterized protein YxjI